MRTNGKISAITWCCCVKRMGIPCFEWLLCCAFRLSSCAPLSAANGCRNGTYESCFASEKSSAYKRQSFLPTAWTVEAAERTEQKSNRPQPSRRKGGDVWMASQNPPAWETLCRNVRWLRESHGFSVEETGASAAPCPVYPAEARKRRAFRESHRAYALSDQRRVRRAAGASAFGTLGGRPVCLVRTPKGKNIKHNKSRRRQQSGLYSSLPQCGLGCGKSRAAP